MGGVFAGGADWSQLPGEEPKLNHCGVLNKCASRTRF